MSGDSSVMFQRPWLTTYVSGTSSSASSASSPSSNSTNPTSPGPASAPPSGPSPNPLSPSSSPAPPSTPSFSIRSPLKALSPACATSSLYTHRNRVGVHIVVRPIRLYLTPQEASNWTFQGIRMEGRRGCRKSSWGIPLLALKALSLGCDVT